MKGRAERKKERKAIAETNAKRGPFASTRRGVSSYAPNDDDDDDDDEDDQDEDDYAKRSFRNLSL